jgi:DNA-binding LacI/PurR family transcriptional regulator
MNRRGSRFHELLRDLRIQIESAFAPGEGLPTKRELASMHGIGTRTIERALKVLTDDGLVTIVPRVGYFKAKRSPGTASKSKVLTVGLLSRRSLDEWPTCEIYPALEDEARRRSIKIVRVPNPHVARHLVERNRIELSRVPWNSFEVGLLVEAEQTIRMRDPLLSNRKVIAVDYDATDFGMDSVDFANAAGGALAARHFLELGHTRFAITDEFTEGGCPSDPANMARRHGFECAIGQAGATLMPQWRLPVPRRASGSNGWYPFVVSTVAAWASLPPSKRPTAILVLDHDTLLKGKLIEVLSQHGLRVPHDLSIIAAGWGGKIFGGIEPSIDGVRLTCLDFDLSTLVRRTFDATEELAGEKEEHPKHPRRQPRIFLAPAMLRLGSSTSAPAQR